ncbi:hypothetical protein FCIRC_1237 [Fusarium circinatum]|uniref:Uncharacterized protein n=1 Tax=Fusarium circinatum TaxID=48490 RepID=A0A8H5UM36_FUSCI|nr:hypothetical protein FCIRC_1237 [Fusarium circinatum]
MYLVLRLMMRPDQSRRITPSAIKSAAEAAMVVARILIENIQRGSGEALLEARVEDFNSIDQAENPTENGRCKEEELVIPGKSKQIESTEAREGEAKHGADEEGSNTAGKPEGHETNIKNGDRSDKPIQKNQGKTKSSACKSKEASKMDEAVELEVLAEYAMIYSLAKDPDPQIQQCYA